MCGITGFVGIKGGISRAVLDAMRDSLAHRGPDGSGTVLFDDRDRLVTSDFPGYAGLAHRRLSIIDLSMAGSQPMANEDRSCWITYNGEFYNFQDYRRDLEMRGHVFQSNCDTETILHLYEEYGIEQTLRRMNGMFAFGLLDFRTKTFVLARDRIGKKPLYYSVQKGGVIFASELKSIYASGLVNPDQLDDWAMNEALVSGSPLYDRTMFRDVRMLPAGHYAVWKNEKLSVHRYYENPFEQSVMPPRNINDWADELEELLVDAIRLRLVSDVPVGLFLSGGIDSSLVAALTARRLGRPINAYCISFEDDGYDESAYAQTIAGHLDIPITVMPAASSNRSLYERIASHIDQPLGDASLVPTYLVSESARNANVKVVLTGDGGDELFGGYEAYRTGIKFWGPENERKLIGQQRTIKEKLWEMRIKALGFEHGYITLQSQFSLKHRLRMYSSPISAIISGRKAMEWRIDILRRVRHRPILDRMQYSDIQTLMIDVILRKVDLMSMANAVECRSPLLDYRVLELAARIRFEEKYDQGGRGKRLLRHLLGRYVPRELFERPKMGFCMPWEATCRGEYAEELKQRWRSTHIPHLKRNTGDWIFSEAGVGGMFRKWNAFAHLVFFENYQRWCRPV